MNELLHAFVKLMSCFLSLL